MNYQAKQDELDKIKWLVSEKKGADACGDFAYCACCDKNADYPCATAVQKHENKQSVKAAVKQEKKISETKPAVKAAQAKATKENEASATASAAKPAAKTAVKKSSAKK